MTSAVLPHEEVVILATANSSTGAAEKKSRGDWYLGLFFIFLVCLLWFSGSIIVQFVADDIGYNRPFVFTYIGSGVISGLVPSYLGLSLLGLVHNPPLREEAGEKNGGFEHEELAAVSNPLKSHWSTFKISLSLTVIWYLSQWSYAASLGYTSVTSSTIITHSGALFAYLFNVAAGSERFTKTKTAGVFLALLGAAMVSSGDKGDDDASKDSVWGDAAALAAAIGYGVYSTVLTVKSPSDDEVSMSLVLGYMGCANMVIFLPLLVGLAVLPGVNALQGLTWHVVQLIVIRAVLEILFSELLWARAILLTTPTVATVGCSMTIPMAFASDFVLHGIIPNGHAVLGSLLVVAGFCFVIDREESVGEVGGGGGGGGSGAACTCVRNRRCCCLRPKSEMLLPPASTGEGGRALLPAPELFSLLRCERYGLKPGPSQQCLPTYRSIRANDSHGEAQL